MVFSLATYYCRGQLHEAYKVTEWREDSVYKTQKLGHIVCKADALPFQCDIKLAAVSTKVGDYIFKDER